MGQKWFKIGQNMYLYARKMVQNDPGRSNMYKIVEKSRENSQKMAFFD